MNFKTLRVGPEDVTLQRMRTSVTPTPPPLSVEPMTRSILFEGLFVHGVARDSYFEAELRKVGFDRDDLLPQYPMSLFRKCLDIACRCFYPGADGGRGAEALGAPVRPGLRAHGAGRGGVRGHSAGGAGALPQEVPRAPAVRHLAHLRELGAAGGSPVPLGLPGQRGPVPLLPSRGRRGRFAADTGCPSPPGGAAFAHQLHAARHLVSGQASGLPPCSGPRES
ncbi:hypothetical protein STIAU_0730 [Stigmatella aurantiaca DW4/3-1]|uniref:Uncharacterized protein n=1 Tax=Stigmatella aurantiaca (strain DW4/3-1) TaxID=378806 RepID=Q08NX1_STIAD|nr:hypothetical protein STIAU_8874 [Stigmatella aurantiaca DW4/3-1]EAU64290.1 hypothetical protein STIAU_0730 [Stigmatella aurantiaca DW4/3-1]